MKRKNVERVAYSNIILRKTKSAKRKAIAQNLKFKYIDFYLSYLAVYHIAKTKK